MWSDICKKCGDLIQQEQYEEAYEILLPCLTEDKEIVLFYGGTIAYALGKIEESINYWSRLLEIRPGFPQAHYNLAACYGIKGDLPNSYKHFESRFQLSSTFALYHQRFKEQHWDGKSSGNTIYVYHEQGIGDMIQLIRFLPQLKKYFKTVIVEAPEELNMLLSGEYVDVVMFRDKMPLPTPKVDYGVSIGSLPFLLGINQETATPKIPYLFAREPRKLSLNKGKKIGVCWLGASHHLHDRFRSATVEDFNFGGNIYNLTVQPSPFINFDFKNFQETANVIDELDLIVTVDTAVAHLAGAMNKPTYLILGKHPDWRWEHGSTTFWYPSIKIIRPSSFKDLSKYLDIV